MKNYSKSIKVVVCLLVLVLSSKVFAESPVWKVTKGDSYLYLGGTIHLLSPNDYPLPEAFDTAYEDAVEIVFETDIAAMSSLEAQALMQKVLISEDGTTLQSKLTDKTYQQLLEFLNARQIPEQALSSLTPGGLSLTLSVLELQRLGASPASGVDQFYNSRSLNDNKEIQELETVEEQISFISSMNEVDPDVLISTTLEDLNQLTEMWSKLLSAWRSGDLLKLNELGIKPMQEVAPHMHKVLLVDRNNNWMQEIDTMIKDKEVEFVLVGALHMAGEHGLIKQLEAADYDVVQLD